MTTNPLYDELRAIIRPMPSAVYEVDTHCTYIEKALDNFREDCGLNLTPDFQRGHVWTQEQQERWIEAVIRNAIAVSGLLIQFNAPNWNHAGTGDLPDEIVCVDGLQRLTAMRRFLAGEILAFGRTAEQFKGTPFDIGRYRFRLAIHTFQTRAELLTYYLDLNAGGTPHPKKEIERVKALRDAALKAM